MTTEEFGPSPRELLKQGKITEEQYWEALKELAERSGAQPINEPPIESGWPPLKTKGQHARRQGARDALERQWWAERLPDFNVTLLPDELVSAPAPSTGAVFSSHEDESTE